MNRYQLPYEYAPGATAVGLAVKDGVVLASERRIAWGTSILSKAGKKVFKINRNVGAACAGLVSDMQVLMRRASAQIQLYELELGRKPSVRAAAKVLAIMLFNQRIFPYFTQAIIGGVENGMSKLYVLDPVGSIIEDDYACVGSGGQIAIGIIEERYKKDMSLEEAKRLAVEAIKAAISRDAKSGDGCDILLISKDGIVEESIEF